MTGDEFKRRFMPSSRKLLAVALRLTGNMQEAEDVVQDVYLRLWERRERLRDISNVDAYCVMTACNVWHDRIRNGKTVTTVSMSDLSQLPSDDSPYEGTENKDYAEIMRQQIALLPPNQRTAVMMRDVDGLDFDEIQQATGMTQVNIRVSLSRARKTLREHFNILKRHEKKRH